MSDCSIASVSEGRRGVSFCPPRLQWLWIAVGALVFWAAGPLSAPVHAQSGINIGKEDAMKSDSADQWLTDTVKSIREKVRRKNSPPNELAGAFIGTPFSDVFNSETGDGGSLGNGCGRAAGIAALGALSDFEQFGTGAVGAAIGTVKGAVDLGKSIYDTGKAVATAGGSTVVEKVGGAAVDALTGAATDTAKDIGKDVAKGTAGDVLKGKTPDLPGKVGEAVQKKIDDAEEFVNGVKDYFKDGPIIFAYTGSKSACTVAMLWVWDEKEINVYIRGTCDCKAADAIKDKAGQSAQLNNFFFHLRASTIRTKNPGILTFALGTIRIVDKGFECGCAKPKTATGGYQPAVPAVCPKCARLAKQISDLEKDIENVDKKLGAAIALSRQAQMGTDEELQSKTMAEVNKLKADKATMEAELEKAKKEKEECEKKPCDDQGGYIYPRTSREQYVTYTTDSTAYCTYTEATTTTEYVTWTDPRTYTPGPSDIPKTPGDPQSTPRPEPSDVPKSPETPKVPGPSAETTPTAPRPSPTPTPVTSTPTPTTTPTPVTTTDTTPPADSDTPSDIPDNVEVKATQAVLEGGPTGTPLEGQTVKLTLTDTPDLPGTANDTAQDTGYDKPPAQCTTDATGGCVIKVEADERPHYNLPQPTRAKPGNYRLELARPRTSGGVAETTGRKKPIDPKLLESVGSKITATTFSIGNRTFERFALEDKYGAENRIAEKLREAFGSDYEEDLCEDKEPGPWSVSAKPESQAAPAQELPAFNVKLKGQPAKGAAR